MAGRRRHPRRPGHEHGRPQPGGVAGRRIAGYVRTILAVLEDSGFGPIERWEVPALDRSGKNAPDAVIEELSRRSDELDDSTYLDLIMPDDTVATVQPAQLPQGDGFSLRLVRELPDGADPKAPPRLPCRRCRDLPWPRRRNRGGLGQADSHWRGRELHPDPPLLEANSHVVLTSEPEVEENYDAPRAFGIPAGNGSKASEPDACCFAGWMRSPDRNISK